MAVINNIINAAPMAFHRGTQDLSTREVPVERPPVPQHLPFFFIQSEKGPLTKQHVTPAQKLALYGSDSFNPLGQYTNHQTMGSNVASANANSCIIQRVSSGTHANMTLYLDVLVDPAMPIYQRDEDGAIVKNQFGMPVEVDEGTTAPGYVVKWVLGAESDWKVGDPLGELGEQVGELTDKDGNPSTRYPIRTFVNNAPGAFGNNVGIVLSAPSVDEIYLRKDDIIEARVYPYNFSIVDKTNDAASPEYKPTLNKDLVTTISFSTNAINMTTGSSYHLDDVLNEEYMNLTDELKRMEFGDFDQYGYTYQDNIDTLLGLFTQAEMDALATMPDAVHNFPYDATTFNPATGEQHLFNFVSGVDLNGNRYHTFAIDDSVTNTNAVRLNKHTNLYAKNAEDRIMAVDKYETEVIGELSRYNDSEDYVQDLIMHPESIFYDTGFSPEVKWAACDIIAIRKDIMYAGATHVDTIPVRGVEITSVAPGLVPTDAALTPAEEISVAIGLLQRMLALPESEYFGTPTARGIIMGGSGKLRNSTWKHRVPLTFYLLEKSAKYMGASNGKWKEGFNFSSAPGNIIDNLTDISVEWVSASQRITNWGVGLNMPLNYSQPNIKHMPALQTVYPDDTSVLNNFLVMMCIIQVVKVSHSSWVEFTGTTDLSDAELIRAVDDYIIANTKGRFDGKYVIKPRTYMTSNDTLRGYSWSTAVEIYANNMRSVATMHIEAYRMSDLEA